MRRARRRHRSQAAQSLVELALVLPFLLVLILGFAGAIFVMVANIELKTATGLATESAFSAPVGDTADALYNVGDSLTRSVHSSFVVPGTLGITCPRAQPGGSGNEYIYGNYHPGTKVSCQAQATLSFRNSVVGLVWRWDVHLQQDAEEQAPPFRQCAAGATC